jgi:hypothetical protein
LSASFKQFVITSDEDFRQLFGESYMGCIGDAKSHINQTFCAMTGFDKITFARVVQTLQKTFYFEPFAGFPNCANFAMMDWRHNRTVKPYFNAPKNEEYSICFKPYAQLVLIIEWATKGSNIKI